MGVSSSERCLCGGVREEKEEALLFAKVGAEDGAMKNGEGSDNL